MQLRRKSVFALLWLSERYKYADIKDKFVLLPSCHSESSLPPPFFLHTQFCIFILRLYQHPGPQTVRKILKAFVMCRISLAK